MCFRNYGLQKKWLDKFLKSQVPEDPLTANVANGQKLCLNLNDSNFTIFIDHCEGN